jgi:hypothetical protein
MKTLILTKKNIHISEHTSYSAFYQGFKIFVEFRVQSGLMCILGQKLGKLICRSYRDYNMEKHNLVHLENILRKREWS